MADEGLPVIARFEVRRRSYLAPDGTVLRPLPDFASDIPKLLEMGVARVFGPGTAMQDIVGFLEQSPRAHHA